MAALASFISNLGVTLQKLLHKRNEGKSDEDKANYSSYALWRVGLGLIIFGSFADFAALGFAPQSEIAPLGALTLVSNTIFAPILLKEAITTRDVVATSAIVIGATVAVSFASHNDVVYGIDELFAFYTRTPFGIYISIITLYISVLFLCIKRMETIESSNPESRYYLKLRSFHRFAYPSISGTVGAQSVLFAKCTVELIVNSFTGGGLMFMHYQTFLVIGCMFTTIFLQIRWLNDGLRRFEATYVVPVFTAFWILLSVASGMVFYREYVGMSAFQMTMFVVGVCITISGVVALSQREIGFTKSRRYRVRGQRRGKSSISVASSVEERQSLLGERDPTEYEYKESPEQRLASRGTTRAPIAAPAVVDDDVAFEQSQRTRPKKQPPPEISTITFEEPVKHPMANSTSADPSKIIL